MKNIIQIIGLGDGDGNTSSMRVINLMVVLAILIPKVVIGIKIGTPVAFTQDDMAMIGIVLGAKLVQNHQETSSEKQVAADGPLQP